MQWKNMFDMEHGAYWSIRRYITAFWKTLHVSVSSDLFDLALISILT